MALVHWNPIGTLAGMEIDRLNRMFSALEHEAFNQAWVPAVDIYETETHEVVIKAELPDVKKEDIGVSVENNVLTLTGERKPEQSKREQFQRVERRFGNFSRSFTLPTSVDAGQIAASYKDGVLTIRLPRREEAKPRQITGNGKNLRGSGRQLLNHEINRCTVSMHKSFDDDFETELSGQLCNFSACSKHDHALWNR